MCALNDGTRRFLNSLSLSFIPFQIYFVGIMAQIALSYYLSIELGLGMKGSGLAMCLAHTLIFIGLNVYPMFIKEPKGLIRKPTREAFYNLKEYIQKGAPVAMVFCCNCMAK